MGRQTSRAAQTSLCPRNPRSRTITWALRTISFRIPAVFVFLIFLWCHSSNAREKRQRYFIIYSCTQLVMIQPRNLRSWITAVGLMLLDVFGLSVIALHRFTEAGVRDWQRGQL